VEIMKDAEQWSFEEGGEDWGEQLLENYQEFAENPEPRCPCVLVLDTSRSMAGEPLAALRHGLQLFRDEVDKNPVARKRVETAVVTFGVSVEVARAFVTMDRFEPPALEARGETPLGAALNRALDLVEGRKARYRAHGVSYFRPWIFLITDGMPQGEPLEVVRQARLRVKAGEQARRLAFFAVGVEGANMKLLARLSVRPALKLEGLRFADFFSWLSVSSQRVAEGRPDDQLALPPVDWAEGSPALETIPGSPGQPGPRAPGHEASPWSPKKGSDPF
jgi:uncharacterized protein YegL